MSGKICYDEIQRVKKLARTDCIQLPAFMRNQDKYKKSLKQIAHMNGLNLDHAKYKAPIAYLRRLKRGRRIGVAGGTNKVRKKGRRGGNSGKGLYVSTGFDIGSEEEDMSLSDDDQIFFQNFKVDENQMQADKFFSSVKMSRIGAYGTDTDYTEYLKTVVGNYEKLKTEKIEVIKSKSEPLKMESKDESLEPGLEANKEHYRCLSRGSIRAILNQPSCSLGSRGKPTSTDSSTSLMNLAPLARPGSDSSPGGVVSAQSAMPQSHITHPLDRFNYNKNAALPAQVPSKTLAQNETPPCTSAVTLSSNMQSDLSNTSTSSSTLCKISTQSTKLTKAASSNDVISTLTEEFIYPSNDILTEDIMQVKEVPLPNIDICQKGILDSSTQVKLLTRRVKSAANILPKLQN